ncbi:MAG: ABC transporter ATP-binding protein [Bacteroidales bacterium]|nr:ABC transporter ATP-binding protein [Bacteroidales bacterium]
MLEASGIRKSFGSLEVLRGVDFHADKGEVVSIMGASGAGKSTLLQILGTLMSADAGSVVIDGKEVSSMKEKELASFRSLKIGFVFQAHHLLPEFTALENVMIPSLIASRGASEAREEAAGLLREVGLEGRMEHKPSELSGGEQQRVAIARSLVGNPAIVFADEPTGNLDSHTKEDIHSLIFSLREKRGQTFVIVTHDSSLAGLCDRTETMKDGLFL